MPRYLASKLEIFFLKKGKFGNSQERQGVNAPENDFLTSNLLTKLWEKMFL